ncbi:MAG: Maf family protein [Acidobacteriota bacterium]
MTGRRGGAPATAAHDGGREGDVALILASASPRRRELLGRLGVGFRVVHPAIDETPLPDESPATHALRIARAKAGDIARHCAGAAVLAADTVVVLGDEILGKPADREAAKRMLGRLAGRDHLVVTAIAARFADRAADWLETARVRFAPLTADLLEWYLETREGEDKAGAYAVQGRGALFIERVEGNVQAVVGLPLAPLPRLLSRVGLRLCPIGDRLRLRRL